MIVLDTETGEECCLWPTEALSRDLISFSESDCKHEKKQLCPFTDAGGNTHYKWQCLTCGNNIGKSIAKRNIGTLPIGQHDPQLQGTYKRRRDAERQEIYQKYLRIQKEESGEFSAKYVQHLRSPEWKATRAKVFRRANNLCEGCLERPPTEVHHLRYDNLGNEFMFELAAVCDDCHERLHPPDISGPEQSEYEPLN